MESEEALVPSAFRFWDHIARVLLKRRKFYVDHQGLSHLETEPWEPPCELTEAPEVYTLRLEVPGVDKRSVTLTLENNKTLRVRGNKARPGEPEIGSVTPSPEQQQQQQPPQPRPQVLFCDVVYGFFNRTIELPGDVDVEHISAVADQGVLTVVLPKTKVTTSTQIPVL